MRTRLSSACSCSCLSLSVSLRLHWRIDYCDRPCAAAAALRDNYAGAAGAVQGALEGGARGGAPLSFILNDSFTHVGGCRRCSHQSLDCPPPQSLTPYVPASPAHISPSSSHSVCSSVRRSAAAQADVDVGMPIISR